MNFEYKGMEMELQIGTYPGGSPKLTVFSYEEGPYASLGKPSFPIMNNGLVVIDDSFEEQKEVVDAMVEAGILIPMEDIHMSANSEYGIYKLVEKEEEAEEEEKSIMASISTDPLA